MKDKSTIDMFDEPPRETAKQRGQRKMAQVLINADEAWKASFRMSIYELPSGWIGLGEKMKHNYLAMGGKQPHKPQAWGAVINGCAKTGWIVTTGDYGTPEDMPSNGCKKPIWRRV